MQLKAIHWLQWGGFGLFCFLLASALALKFFGTGSVEQSKLSQSKRELPKSPFTLPDHAYASIGEASLHLKFIAPRQHAPNLRTGLIYYGQNGRPDALQDQPKMHFGFQGGKALIATKPLEKVYLIYDKKLSTPCKYTFSPGNEATDLWFVAEGEYQEAKVAIAIQDEEGLVNLENDVNALFNLPEKELSARQARPWEIGKWRVDGTLLARQKAKWMGLDRFIERHGGEEYQEAVGKHRIDFADGDESYSVYVKASDCLVWDQDQWKKAPLDGSSSDKPLLVVKKIEDRIMMLDLWDVAGKGKVTLTLIRTPETFHPEQSVRDFRFVGARTKTQVVFQVDDERVMVKPHDWFLLTDEGWRKLKTAEEIDDYVNRKLVGPLFIFEEIAKKDEKPVLIGSIFNAGRTEEHPIEVAMIPYASPATPGACDVLPCEKGSPEIRTEVVTPIANH